jgi:hypothetical protein
MDGNKSFSRTLLAVVCIGYFFELNFVLSAVSPGVDVAAATGPSILAGHPTFAAFQNRLLAPFLQHMLETLGLSRNYAFAAAIAALLAIVNFVFLLGSRRLPAAQATLFYFATMAVWLLLFTSNIYLWDFIDTALFLSLAFVALGTFSERAIPLLFALALLNRESAAFIGLWVIVTSWKPSQGIKRGRAMLGALMIAITFVYVLVLRNVLLISAEFPGDVLGGSLLAVGHNVGVVLNLKNWPMQVPLLVGLVGALGVFGYKAVKGPDPQVPLFIFLSIIISCLFGFWAEPRVFLFLSPLIALESYRSAFADSPQMAKVRPPNT